jgi:hypothetical protein
MGPIGQKQVGSKLEPNNRAAPEARKGLVRATFSEIGAGTATISEYADKNSPMLSDYCIAENYCTGDECGPYVQFYRQAIQRRSARDAAQIFAFKALIYKEVGAIVHNMYPDDIATLANQNHYFQHYVGTYTTYRSEHEVRQWLHQRKVQYSTPIVINSILVTTWKIGLKHWSWLFRGDSRIVDVDLTWVMYGHHEGHFAFCSFHHRD